jgi:hypothetical protein
VAPLCEHATVQAAGATMKFAVKIKHKGQPARWDYFDDPRVNDNLDAAAFGKVMAEGWNNDLKSGETKMRILNAQVIGPGKNKKQVIWNSGQLDMFSNRSSRRMQ